MKKLNILTAATLALAIGAGSLTSCDSDHSDRYPEKYRAVVKFMEEGQLPIDLYSTEATQIYTINVLKGGWQPEAIVPTTVGSMTDAEFAAYTEDLGFTYLSAVPNDCYYFNTPGNQTVSFDFGDEDYKLIDFTIIPEKVNEFLVNLPASQTAVIPLIVKAENATVDEDGQHLFLVPTYNEPKLGFKPAGMKYTVLSPADATAGMSVPVKVTLPVENKWDLKFTVSLDEEALAAYNQANGSNFTLMDPSIYSGFSAPEQTFTFPQGATEATIDLVIDGTKLPYAPVALPLKITSITGVNIEADPAAGSTILGYEISLISSYSTNDQEPTEGPLENLFDGNPGTFFHSTWSSAATATTHDPVYGSYVQFNLAAPLQSISFDFQARSSNANGAPTEVALYVSNDGQNWTLMDTVTGMGDILTGAGAKGHWGPFTAAEPFTYLRWCVLSSKAGALTSPNGAYWNGAELQLINSAQ